MPYLVYKTNEQHSYASRDLIGVTSGKGTAISICKKQAKKEGYKIDKEGYKIDKDQLFNLNNIQQTQGYEGTGEFFYEFVQPNILL